MNITRSALALIAVVALAGCGANGSTGDPVPTASPKAGAASKQTPPKGAEPADVNIESTCDYLLDFDASHSFVATAFLTNEGGTDAVVVVKAAWRQSGSPAVTKAKRVKVPADGEEVEVQISRKATDAMIDRIQALDSEKMCKVTGTVVA